MNRIFKSIKDHIKKMLGRHYEPILRQPYVRLRALKRTMVFELPGTLSGGINSYAAMYLQLFVATGGRQLQLQAQACRCKSSWNPMRWLVCPLLEAATYILERFYRLYFRRFGVALAALPSNAAVSRGLLLVSGSLGSGGSERQTVLTALGLTQRGLQPLELAVVYLRSEAERFYLHKLESAGMPVREFDRDTSRDGSDGLQPLMRAVNMLPPVLRDVADYARTLVAVRPEIVHLWLDEVNVKGGLAAVAARVPRIVLSGRNLPPNNYLLYHPYMREGYRWLLQQPGVTLINNSAAGARAYERWLGLREGSIRVVYNGFDFDEPLLSACRKGRVKYRERYGIHQDAPLVGTVIRLSEEKRPLLWAEIAAHIGRTLPEAHFLIAGDGSLRNELEARAVKADLAGRLHVVGVEKQALEAMAAMDLFLLSSRGEGLPNVLVEAQALGVPVVTTQAGGAPEALDDRRTGRVLSSDKPEEAAAEIVCLLGDKSWLHAASVAGPEFVKMHFGLERMLDETLEVYGDRAKQLAVDAKNHISEGIAS